MPSPDPTPHPAGDLKRRFWRIFRLLTLLSLVVSAIAVLLVAPGQPHLRIHNLIATPRGPGRMVQVGGALMSLVFLSASSGHDDSIGDNPCRSDDEDKR